MLNKPLIKFLWTAVLFVVDHLVMSNSQSSKALSFISVFNFLRSAVMFLIHYLLPPNMSASKQQQSHPFILSNIDKATWGHLNKNGWSVSPFSALAQFLTNTGMHISTHTHTERGMSTHTHTPTHAPTHTDRVISEWNLVSRVQLTYRKVCKVKTGVWCLDKTSVISAMCWQWAKCCSH